MEFVNKVYEIILYFVETLKGLIKFFKGEEEETVVDDTVTE